MLTPREVLLKSVKAVKDFKVLHRLPYPSYLGSLRKKERDRETERETERERREVEGCGCTKGCL